MALTDVKGLKFILSLKDRVSGPAQKIQETMQRLTKNTRAGFRNMAYGAAALTSSYFLISQALAPAIEQTRALGEVAALGVQPKALEILSRESLRYSMEYGENATAFVRASYDIQSAIDGLSGLQLSSLTTTSGVLAKATKSDVGTITSYMGTMYGIFKKQAKLMGTDNFAMMLADQTAQAVKIFKTTGSEMEAAFSRTGAKATSAFVPLSEQMAVLGSLQATLGSGSEAGTQYVSFLSGVGKAQKALGLQFTDSAGRMLPIVDILTKIKGKYGEIDTVAESDLLQKAFGRKEAVSLIQSLSVDIGKISKDMHKLKRESKGVSDVMARLQVDPFQRLSASIRGAAIALGNKFIPVIEPFINKMSDGLATVTRWTEMFPNLARVVSIAAVSLLAFTGVMGALMIVAGLVQLVFSPIILTIAAIVLAIGLFDYAVYKLFTYLKKAVPSAIESISNGISAGMNSLKQTVAPVFDWINTQITSLMMDWNELVSGFQNNVVTRFVFNDKHNETMDNLKFNVSASDKHKEIMDRSNLNLNAEERAKVNPSENLLRSMVEYSNESSTTNQGTHVENLNLQTNQELNPFSLENIMSMGLN